MTEIDYRKISAVVDKFDAKQYNPNMGPCSREQVTKADVFYAIGRLVTGDENFDKGDDFAYSDVIEGVRYIMHLAGELRDENVELRAALKSGSRSERDMYYAHIDWNGETDIQHICQKAVDHYKGYRLTPQVRDEMVYRMENYIFRRTGCVVKLEIDVNDDGSVNIANITFKGNDTTGHRCHF